MVLRELELWHGLEDLLHISLHELHNDKDAIALVLWSDDIEDLGGEAVVLHFSELSQDLNLANDLL